MVLSSLRGLLLVWVLPLALILGSCSRRSPDPGDGPDGISAATGAPPLALIKSGNSPLWFELGPGGPVHIADPSEAAQEPLTPWRLSRHVAGMAVQGNTLTLAVNREGFLVLALPEGSGEEGRIALYQAAEPFWRDYTLGALFMYQDTPTALLYRDDFFIDSGAALPDPRIWQWERGNSRLQGTGIPAFSGLPAGEGWDIEALSQGQDRRWYYRGVRKNDSPPEPVYFCSADPGEAGEIVPPGVFRNATMPYTIESTPEELRSVLLKIGQETGKTPVAAAVSPEFSGLRYYTGVPAGDIQELAGFYSPRAVSGPAAAVLFPDGRLLYSGGSGEEPRSHTLPPLPEGFVYTRICLLGNIVAAAWEEQEDWSVGAAGFMVINGPWAF